MKKENVIEKGMVAIKGITAMIPVLGGTLTSVWSDIDAIQAKRKHERLEEFYLSLEMEVQKIKEQINESYINQPDFLDVFEQTARHIVNERKEEKRILFRNILLSSITAKECSYDKTEKYLRILEEEGSNSNLVVSLNSIPKDTYVSENDIMLYKAKVPNEAFGKVGLSFTGKKVAISTKGQEQTYICVANIEDSITTFMGDNSATSGGNGDSTMSQLEELFEKPIAKKIVSLDLLKDCNINNFIFSKKEDSLAVVYSNGNGVRRVNIYNANEGNIISKAINEEFNEAEYNIDEIGFNAEEFIFNVSKAKSEGYTNEKEGKYSFDVESYEIKKL